MEQRRIYRSATSPKILCTKFLDLESAKALWRTRDLSIISCCFESAFLFSRLVITTCYDGSGTCYIIKNKDVLNFLETHKNHTLVLHNFSFDARVFTQHCGFEWWEMIESGKILDTALLFKLVSIATRGFTPARSSLDFVVGNLLKDVLPKDNSIRLTFGQYLNEDGTVRYKDITKGHYVYALLDPIATYLVWENLASTIKTLPTSTNLAHTIHLMGDIALDDIERRGIAIDLEYTNNLREGFRKEMDYEAEIVASFGWVRGVKGNQESYNEICKFLELDLPMTDNGYSMKTEDLECYSHLPFVQSIMHYLETEKKYNYLSDLTTERVHPYYDSIKNTARTSCRKPNIQNPPVKGGIRECFVPKEGKIFANADYSAIEMFTAAICMKEKGWGQTMHDVLNAGLDPHKFAAASINKCTEEEVSKDQRQQAKPANYGFLANMSAETFIPYAAGYGLDLSLEESNKIKKGWANAFPEVKQFWKAPYKAGGMFIARSGFIRAHCTYTAWLNTHFQGRAAEGAKVALYLCYKGGLDVVLFCHDEIVIEADLENPEPEKKLLEKYMEDGMKMICDMNIVVKATLMTRHGK